MNLPNKLTVLRLLLAPVFVACLSLRFPGSFVLAFLIFLAATLTDYLDGVIARKHGLITDFGKLMDPLADKVLIAAAFICMIPLGAIPAWAVIAIIAREFLITGLRLLAGSQGSVLPAEKIGKHKTAWQMATIIFYLLLLALGHGILPEHIWLLAWNIIGPWLVTITVILTLYSGLAYYCRNSHLIRTR
ncbi:MAG: CDP-diacylglycerol--glycerol-3-phosphate 3-phosphatidyltransferase [Terrimicrobiaceae bacterium]